MSDTTIHSFAKWKVRPGHVNEVLAMLEDLHANSIKEKGNLFYKVYQDNGDPHTLILYEGYTDEEALALHRNSKYYIAVVVDKMPALLQEREVVLTTPLEI